MRKPRTHSSQTVFENEWIAVKQDTLSLSQNHNYVYTYVSRHHDGVMVVPYFTATDSVLIVSQYRHPVQKIAWGFPGGGRDENQTFQDCAKKELLEETGYKADQLIDLGPYMPDMGILSNTGRVFVAIDPKKTTEPVQASLEEVTEPKIVSLTEFKQMIEEGEVRDGWSLGPFSIFLLWLEKEKSRIK